MSRMTAVKKTESTTPTPRPFWATMRATSPRVIMPTPTLRESPQLKRQTFAARPQPMILVIRATTTKQTLNSRMVRGQAADIGLEADAGEEDGGEEHVAADVHPALDVGRILQGAEHDARNVSARDVGDAEVLLRDVGHGKAERQADDGDALGVGVATGPARAWPCG